MKCPKTVKLSECKDDLYFTGTAPQELCFQGHKNDACDYRSLQALHESNHHEKQEQLLKLLLEFLLYWQATIYFTSIPR
jgi:hypothetical protein